MPSKGDSDKKSRKATAKAARAEKTAVKKTAAPKAPKSKASKAKAGKAKAATAKTATAKAETASATKTSAKTSAKTRAGKGAAAAPAIAKLEAKIARQEAKLAEARAELAALKPPAKPAPKVSPLAPAAFPALPPIAGVRMAAAEAGVRYKGRLDVALFSVEGKRGGPPPAIAGVFTRSLTRSAPVLWCEEQLAKISEAKAAPRRIGVIVNSGNSNAFTGDNGRQGVAATVKATAQALGAARTPVFVSSTGVIGEPLPAERITAKLEDLSAGLDEAAWPQAARAIMTTDTFPKGASATATIGETTVTVAGIAKGSGMIAPDMATMLVYVFTDAAISQKALQKLTSEITDRSFNAITVDGDTSTSDTLLMAASGHAGNTPIVDGRSDGYAALRDAMEEVFLSLAHQVVRDGEGATKFVELRVSGAKTPRAARAIGLAIANSPLVKTAWAGEDPNWGRIVMAVGKSGEAADRDTMTIRYGDHPVAEKGWRSADYDEATLAAYMKNPEIVVSVDVGVGSGEAKVWTCDLTHGYISINADYRS